MTMFGLDGCCCASAGSAVTAKATIDAHKRHFQDFMNGTPVQGFRQPRNIRTSTVGSILIYINAFACARTGPTSTVKDLGTLIRNERRPPTEARAIGP